MNETRFYELSHGAIEKALPQLLYKIYDNMAKPILLLLNDVNMVNSYNKLLWSFSSNKFLPHGTKHNSIEHIKPLFLTDQEENLNNAEILVSTVIPQDEKFSTNFKQRIFMFNKEASTEFINIFRNLKGNNAKATYWQQDALGKWHDI